MSARRVRMYCSFCRRDDQKVPSLVAGPAVYICGDCVELARRAIRGDRLADFGGLESMSTEQLIELLHPAQMIADHANEGVVEVVAVLRGRGASWARIGDGLGTSRQAAWERYASYT